ncbi:ankyrin repeat domain-containing protein [Deinococcus cellulosilyticus]|uniref:Uncharacterized protein n=1 Tax=Deinococcus cellulosilyticus (strain DSM 18568 / NBRC 106333 / KACC 11606 / 5516J-15) TaxID=1223518 RepID=A0A511MZA9_DEIC1|nr:ankyrin repeat domain-containing protein [Deinococcus cellulosilyticus]GEM45608.1 hypothetical protein DC3_12430 [Deinococcus cellulosilyticus NBRC 106333 = KACC 11606]
MPPHIKKAAQQLNQLMDTADLETMETLMNSWGEQLPEVLGWQGSEKHLPPLHHAILQGKLDVARLLLQKGARLELRDHRQRTPLYLAYAGKHVDLALELLQMGASMDTQNTAGTRVLDVVVASGNLEHLEMFLQKGLLLDHQNQHGMTPLHWAAWSGNPQMVDRVLEHTAFPLTVKDHLGRLPLHHSSTVEVFDHLLSLFPDQDVNTRFENGRCFVHLLAERGHFPLLRHLYERGEDLTVTDLGRNTVLHYASVRDQPDMVGWLISVGQDVNSRNHSNQRPLHWAAELGTLEVVKVLLAHGAKVNVKTNFSDLIRHTQTPLYMAVSHSHLEVARLLLQHRAKVNEINDSSNTTALCEAVSKDDLKMMQLLLDHGALPRGISRKGDAPYEYFYFPLGLVRSPEALDLLLQHGADINERNRYEGTALHWLVDRMESRTLKTPEGQKLLEVLDRLIALGANVQAENNHGRTPLADAQSKQVSERLTAAMQHGGSAQPLSAEHEVQQTLQDHYTDLIQGMVHHITGTEPPSGPAENATGVGRELFELADQVDTVHGLAAFEAVLDRATPQDVQHLDTSPFDSEETALLRVTYRLQRFGKEPGFPEISDFHRVIHKLLSKGANPNHPESLYGDGALHKVVKASSTYHRPEQLQALFALIDLLLEHGAEVNLKNADFNTPLDFVTHQEILEHLRSRGGVHGKHNGALFEAIESGKPKRVQQMLDLEAKVNGKDPEGITPLMHAANHARPELVRLLLDHEAQVASKDRLGRTALHFACARGAFEVIDHLLQAGADPNVQTRQGETPLEFLVRLEWPRNEAVEARQQTARTVTRMVARGADLSVKNQRGHTPLDLCSTQALRTEIERALREKP